MRVHVTRAAYLRKNYRKKSDVEMAHDLGVSTVRIQQLRRELGLSKGHVFKPIKQSSASSRMRDDVEQAAYRARLKDFTQKYKAALSQIDALRDELNLKQSLRGTIERFTIKARRAQGSSATAVWVASDWHVGEKVTYAQTNGLNQYNPEISKSRGEQFFTNALRLTNMMAKEVHIDTVILALLGDFITGHLHLDAVETNYLPPVEETIYAQNIIISGIEHVLKHSKYSLIIPCHSGNHGRTTKFSHFGSENGHSLEFFMFHNLQDHFRDESRVRFIISEGAHTYVDVYGYSLRFLHGHDIKYGGGVGGLTIPVNKAIAQWDKGRKAHYTIFGHFHQRFDGGNFIANGSMIGYNAFALSIKASAEPPAQQLFLVDSKRAKTGVWPILFTDENKKHHT